jgi:prepilin-type processing-associated H-X9-DG protein
MEQTAVYNSANFNMVMRGNGTGEVTNFTATTTVINSFLCPSSTAPIGTWSTGGLTKPWPGNNYFASTGSTLMYRADLAYIPNGIFMVYGNSGVVIGIRDVLDGTSNTIAFGEWRGGDYNDFQYSIQDVAGSTNTGAFPPPPSGGTNSRDMATPFANMPMGGSSLTPFLQACAQCWQAGNCPSHGTNGQFSFIGRLWAESTYAHGLGNVVVPPNSPYPNCQIENGDSDTDSAGVYGLSSNHSGGANVALADGSVRFIKASINWNTLWALGSRGQNEVIDASSY